MSLRIVTIMGAGLLLASCASSSNTASTPSAASTPASSELKEGDLAPSFTAQGDDGQKGRKKPCDEEAHTFFGAFFPFFE